MCYQGLKACVNKCPAALICWAPIVLGCRPQWQMHQANSCCKRAYVSGAWCMSATELYIFSRSFDMLKYPHVGKSAHVSGAWVHDCVQVILKLMGSTQHPQKTWISTSVLGERFRMSIFNFWQTFWKIVPHQKWSWSACLDRVHIPWWSSALADPSQWGSWWHLSVSTGELGVF